ncbi:MAG: hypothetical protein ACR2LL_04080 [Nitrosopumilus sp.]
MPLEQSVFTNKITKSTDNYTSNTIQADAVNHLKWEGEQETLQGQKIRYIINDYYGRKKSKRVMPIELAKRNDCKNIVKKYDVKRYSELLDECCKSIIEPLSKQVQ